LPDKGQGRAKTLIEGDVAERFSELGRSARLLDAASQAPQGGNDVFGDLSCHPSGGSCFGGGRGLNRDPCVVCPVFVPREACFPTLLFHELLAERALGFVLIVRTAAEAKPFHGRRTPARNRLDVIELQEAPGVAAMPARAHEGAATLFAFPDGPTDMGWYVAVARDGRLAAARAGGRGALRNRATGGAPKLSLLELRDQRIEGSVEHL
jgi:hypothetical protein